MNPLKKILKTYLPFTKAGIQGATTYRVNFIAWFIGDIMICFVMYYVWRAVFLSSGSDTFNGFTMTDMVVFLFVSNLTGYLTGSEGSYEVGEEIRDGTIAMRLIKPVSYNATFLFQELGNKLPTEIAIAVPMIILVEIARTVMSGEVQFNALNLLLYILSCVTAYLINFYFNICFGFLAFVIKYLWGANMMKNCIIGFLSGTVIPLSFLPDALERVFLFLPFASLNYTPVMIYMGKYSGAKLCYYLGLQIFWALFFFGLSKALWKASVKRLSVQGG